MKKTAIILIVCACWQISASAQSKGAISIINLQKLYSLNPDDFETSVLAKGFTAHPSSNSDSDCTVLLYDSEEAISAGIHNLISLILCKGETPILDFKTPDKIHFLELKAELDRAGFTYKGMLVLPVVFCHQA